jgi:hypothetical protein
VLLVATGCGGDDDDDASNGDSTTPTTLPGELFVDPQGAYTMTIAPDWSEIPDRPVPEVEAWTVAPARDGFAANVTVLSQHVEGLDLERYMEVSGENIGEFEQTGSEIVTGTNGNELGVLEYHATDSDLHYLGVVSVANSVAVVATLSAVDAEQLETLRPRVEPYMLTLAPIIEN